jgi:fucose 4-O-acetylase-like acetyltransferase
MKGYAMARLSEVDSAKGIAIFFVVLGHIVARTPPAGNQWHVVLKSMIYMFHMPFFMFISGLVVMYNYKPIRTIEDYKDFLVKKFRRLMPGFLIVGLLILVGKLVMQQYMFVDNLPEGFYAGLVDILLRPTLSSASALWYIYVLLELFILLPLWANRSKFKYLDILLFALVIYFVPATDFLALKSLGTFLFFFVLGGVVALYYERFSNLIHNRSILFTAIFAASFLLMHSGAPFQLSRLLIGTCSIPALMALITNLKVLNQSSMLISMGRYTYVIYLLNTIIIGFTKGIIFKFTTWDGHNFLFVAPVLLFNGIVIPILMKKYIFSRNNFINSVTN